MAGTFLYAGCYTHESPVGIRVYDASDPGGRLVERSRLEGVEHPSFLAAHPNGRFLYAVSETTAFEGDEGGGLVAFGIEPTDGSLTPLDKVSSQGAAPCHVSVGPDGRHVHVANYVSGTIAVYSLEPEGRFGELLARRQHSGSGPSPRQDDPHAHCVVPAPGGGSVYAVDLGADRIFRYQHSERHGAVTFDDREELGLEAGSGPRHLVFHPEHPIAFLVCELRSTIEVLELDPATGRLRLLGSEFTVPGDFADDSIAAEVRVHPAGRWVYVSNRGHDSIAVFECAGPREPLRLVCHVRSGGRTPRNFAVHPSGRALLVANQDSDSIVLFRIDQRTGVPLQLETEYRATEPVCLTFVDGVG